MCRCGYLLFVNWPLVIENLKIWKFENVEMQVSYLCFNLRDLRGFPGILMKQRNNGNGSPCRRI